MAYVRYEASNAKIREQLMPDLANCYSILERINKLIYCGDLKKSVALISKHIRDLELINKNIKHIASRNNSLRMHRLSAKSKRLKNLIRSKIRVGQLLLRQLKQQTIH